jgi:uncharacterized protein (DUF58 family)
MNGLSIILLVLVIAGICTWGIAGIFIVLGLAWLIAFAIDNINSRVDATAKAREEEVKLQAEAEYTVKKAFYDMRVSQYKKETAKLLKEQFTKEIAKEADIDMPEFSEDFPH